MLFKLSNLNLFLCLLARATVLLMKKGEKLTCEFYSEQNETQAVGTFFNFN